MNRLMTAVFCFSFAFGSIAIAQEKKQPAATPATAPAAQPGKKAEQPAKKEETKKEAAPDAAGMMDDKPGEMHVLLEAFEGEWQASAITYENGKAGKPEAGTMKAKIEFGGRFLHNDYNGRSQGKFFHGEGFMGYSNASKRFEMCWVDSQSTGVTFMVGQFDAAKKVLTMTGEMTMVGGMKVAMRSVSTIVDKSTIKDEFFMTIDGKEVKAMEVAYTKGGEAKSEKKTEKAEKTEKKEKSEKK